MSDERLDLDTLFMVFEEDFRLFPDVEEPEPPAHAAQPLERASRPSGAPAQEKKMPRAGGPRDLGAYYEVPSKAPKEEHESFPRCVVSWVHIASAAQRLGVGGLIWMSWLPENHAADPKKPYRLSNGSTFIMCTVPAARSLLRACRQGEIKRGHWDLSLKEWLYTHHRDVNGCYFFPPCGNYATHPSGCDPKLYGSGRPNDWCRRWSCQGTIVEEDPQKRQKWLVTWQANGKPEWLADISKVMRDENYDWKTYASPEEPPAPTMLSLPPPGGATTHPAATGSNKIVLTQKGKASAEKRQSKSPARQWLGADADEEDDEAMEVAAEPAATATEEPKPKRTKRQIRIDRRNKLYGGKFRIYVDDQAEARHHMTRYCCNRGSFFSLRSS